MRLIDADELLRKLEEYFNEKEQDAKFTGNRGSEVSWNDAIYYIRTAPSVQPEQRWIPVSEKLPEDFQRVLVTIVNYEGDKVIRVAEYHNWKGAFQIKENHEQWKVGEKGLLAWMPLPEPYGGEQE